MDSNPEVSDFSVISEEKAARELPGSENAWRKLARWARLGFLPTTATGPS
jgi:hypothetical protein